MEGKTREELYEQLIREVVDCLREAVKLLASLVERINETSSPR